MSPQHICVLFLLSSLYHKQKLQLAFERVTQRNIHTDKQRDIIILTVEGAANILVLMMLSEKAFALKPRSPFLPRLLEASTGQLKRAFQMHF